MDFHHLKYFVEVADQKSFSKAARNLHISQSAISRTIKALEDELGVVLFMRNAKSVELTDGGTIFLTHAKRVVFMFEHLKTDFENEFRLEQGSIRIGIPPITDAPIFAQLLGEFTDYTLIFCCSLGSCLIGFLCASLVKTTYKPPVKREPISLDRFILLKGIPAGFSLLLLSIPYGMTTNYVAMYAKQIGIQSSTGFFFTFMALGMAVSRLFSGRLVDRGMVTQVIEAGLYLVCFCFFGLSSCGWLTTWSLQWTTYFLFTIALLLGIGFGTMFPAYNTLFVNLAPNNQRGTATSTYLTSWDVGIGAGMLLGGYIAEIATFKMAYLFGAALTVISLFYFRSKVAPHFHRHKLR